MTALAKPSAQGGAGGRPWGAQPSEKPSWLGGYSVLLGLLFALPGIFVLVKALQFGGALTDTLVEALNPLWRTVLLATSVAVTSASIGTGLAWTLVRTNLVGRRLLHVLAVLPLGLPSFVGAAAFIAALAPGGMLHGLLETVGFDGPFRARGFWPSWFVLTLATYPYVLLPVAARLRALRPSLEESSRLLGRSSVGTFFAVTLPQLRASVLAGAMLVFLYTVSEFGAVQLLGFDTLTRVIFATQLTDRATSFSAAALLLLLAVVVVAVERSFHEPIRPDDRANSRFGEAPTQLGRWSVPALVAVCTVVGLALFAPIVSLSTWAIRGLVDRRVNLGDLAGPALNTAVVGVFTALVAVVAVLPLAVLIVRHRSAAGRVASVAVIGGFAVPGIVIALSLVFWAANTPVLSALYQTFPILILAYVIHFGSQALGAAETAVRAVPEGLRDSARLLSPSRFDRRRLVELPLMRPGLLSGGGLVLLSTIKELPATLLLAPLGFETLATEVWGSFEEGFYAEVGVASLALVALSAILTWGLVLRNQV